MIEQILCFPTHIYRENAPLYFERLRDVSMESLSKSFNSIDDVYPVKMSQDISQDPRIQDFCEYTAKMALSILSEQGYLVDNKSAYFESMWCQEHHRHSMMEQHVHPGNIKIVGFYFLDVPPDCSLACFHDPRPAKIQSGEPERNISEITDASNGFYIKPEPGGLILSNSWVPHSFTRQRSPDPFRFVHFNICLTDQEPTISCRPADEIV